MESKRLQLQTTPATVEGTVTAIFATLNVVDKDGDVILPGAFTDGQAVPLVWHHRWESPIGKGQVRLTPTQALFEGHFFLETQAGAEAYKTVQAMGALQEWSWGFRVVETRDEQRDGRRVRVIVKADLFEVSPVLVGAGRGTGTVALKAQDGPPPEVLQAWGMYIRQVAGLTPSA